MSYAETMELAARDYAADLRARGYLGVELFRYDTPLDNREPYRRDHRTAFGWAVRYTSSPEMDQQVMAGARYGTTTAGNAIAEARAPKFHNRSLTVFTGPATGLSGDDWLNQCDLVRGAVLADFAGEMPVPMYTAAWSPADGPHAPAVPSVIMKRFPVRADDSSYPWQVGPRRYYHLVMTPADGARFARGPEPAAMTDR